MENSCRLLYFLHIERIDMLNLIWGSMILIGIIYAAINGTMQQVNTAAIESAREAVTLCITMLGVMGLWLGMMEVARAAGIMDRLTKALRPFLQIGRAHV